MYEVGMLSGAAAAGSGDGGDGGSSDGGQWMEERKWWRDVNKSWWMLQRPLYC